MSARNGFVLLVALSALMFLGACGNGGSGSVTNGSAPPSGGFTGGALNGTYVFSTAGFNVDGYFMVMTGAFTANGKQGVTGGAIDIVTGDPAVGVLPNQTVGSTSSYVIGQDGRGQVNLITGTALGTVSLDFVMSSNAHGLITEYDGNGNGSGTIDLQSSSLSQSQFAGSYAFSISGTGLSSGASFATVGDMTLDASGNVTTGIQDFNNGGGATTGEPLGAPSTVTVGSGTAPGTASLATALGTYAFDVYAIDNTHLKFVETDSQLVLAGDAFTQGTSLPTSQTIAFTMSGSDTSGSPLGIGGLMPLDANSNVTTGGTEDFNDGGVVGADSSFAGGFSPISAGRSVLTLTGFVNSATNQIAGSYTFAAYPFTSNGVTGLQLLEIDNGLGVTSGSAYVQTGTSLATSQGYGLNLSAIDLGNGSGEFEEDDIAEFSTTSSGFSGKIDYNDGAAGGLTQGQSLSGSYTASGPTGRYTVTTTNAPNFNLYAVNGSTFLLLETDSNQIGTGVVELQNASGSVSSEPGVTMHRSTAGSHPLLRRR